MYVFCYSIPRRQLLLINTVDEESEEYVVERQERGLVFAKGPINFPSFNINELLRLVCIHSACIQVVSAGCELSGTSSSWTEVNSCSL